MLVFCLGDMHIPKRASELPEWVFELLMNKRPDRILVTGDLTDPAIIYLLERIAPVYAVRGNMDHMDLPQKISLEIDGLKILLIHGNQFGRGNYSELIEYVKKDGHNLVVCGHTHKPETFKEDGVAVINPGSATGAPGGDGIPTLQSVSIINTEIREVVQYTGEKNGNKNKRFQI